MSVRKERTSRQNLNHMNQDTIKEDYLYDYFLKLLKVIVPVSTFLGVAMIMRFWWVNLPRKIFYENNILYEAPVMVTIAKAALILRFPILVLALALIGLDLRDMRKKSGRWSTVPIRSVGFLMVNLMLESVVMLLRPLLVHFKLS